MEKFVSRKDLEYFGVEGSAKDILRQVGFGIALGVACMCALWLSALIG